MMKPYADTNFLTALFCGGAHGEQAAATHKAAEARRIGPLPVTPMLSLEFINALQQLVFLSRHGVQNLRFTPEIAMFKEELFIREMADGIVWNIIKPDVADFEKMYTALVHRHTATHGFRTYDIIHVASAIVLGCDTFWSFDEKARKLAKLEGLKLN